jgi:hypothetical protein
MTIGQASAVNTLIQFICQQPGPAGTVPTADQALQAANTLAQGAYRKLQAGYTGNGDIEKVWPREPNAMAM